MSSIKGTLVTFSLLLHCVLGSASSTAKLSLPNKSASFSPNAVTQSVEALVKNVGGLLNNLTDPTSVLSVLEGMVPTATPTNINQVAATLSAIHSSNTAGFYVNIGTQIKSGLVVPFGPADPIYALNGENSHNNNNTAEPKTPVYPKKSDSDAPYSVPEAQLREAIYIPATFTYGQKQPTIFVPGTGSIGGISFASNLRKLLTNVSYADPVWLNIPGYMLNDAQVNSEYIAYAINYVSGISQNRNVSIISWSQGGLATQWALTFWPSTRTVVSDFLPVSPDFHGTAVANLLCLSAGGQSGLGPCAPSVLQQEYTSTFVSMLRARGGASAYVPTTTMYSGFFDEVVEPQSGTDASAYLQDERGVGVLNVEVQKACTGFPAETFFYDHTGVLYSYLAYALVVDALNNDGPANLSRLNLSTICGSYAAPGLSLEDVVSTAGLTVLVSLEILAAPAKQTEEPALMPYTNA